ncbi:MAG TPA: hypothetical protein VJ044_12905 [Candidatus Hodarchaeales archaeon]|nr:hypothetical protein [Candidatus Hodarchaeales archaeon]
MTEYGFRARTKILLIGSTTLFLSWLLDLFFYFNIPGTYLTVIAALLSSFGIYATATDMDLSIGKGFSRLDYSKKNPQPFCAAWFAVIMALAPIIINIVLFILIERFGLDSMETLAFILFVLGSVVVIISGYVSKQERDI